MSESEPNIFGFLIKDKYFKLLKPFFDSPKSQFYVNQLKEITKISPRILIQELKNLEKQGILKSEKLANAKFYKLQQNKVTKQIGVVFR